MSLPTPTPGRGFYLALRFVAAESVRNGVLPVRRCHCLAIDTTAAALDGSAGGQRLTR